MSFFAGVPLACIALCRTALEAGLRERLAEKIASSSEEVWDQIKKRGKTSLRDLLKEAEREEILSEKQLREAFKFTSQFGRHVLDKYIHADWESIISLLEGLELDTRVVGAKNKIAEKRIQAEAYIEQVATSVLAVTTKIAETLYLLPD